MNFIKCMFNENFIVYRIKSNDNFLSWDYFFQLINTNNDIIQKMILILKSCPFESYFLEFHPVSFNILSETIFEFVIVKTTSFLNKTDIITFGKSNLNTNSNNIYTFYNLSKTSILISPCYNYNYDINIYNNICTFMRSNNFEQQNKLLITIFSLYLNILYQNRNKLYWLSTHGKGVGWLHVRIDDCPKYISWSPYK